MYTSAVGRLGQTPRDIETKRETAMSVSSMAVDLDTNEENAHPLWVGVIAFGQLADVLRRHDKGDQLAVSGRLQRRVYQDRSGQQREQLQVVADTIVSARAAQPAGAG